MFISDLFGTTTIFGSGLSGGRVCIKVVLTCRWCDRISVLKMEANFQVFQEVDIERQARRQFGGFLALNRAFDSSALKTTFREAPESTISTQGDT